MLVLTREDVDEMFATHDKDRDGMLSWEEFSGEETKNEKAFKLMDADHNGKITKSVSWNLKWQNWKGQPQWNYHIFVKTMEVLNLKKLPFIILF